MFFKRLFQLPVMLQKADIPGHAVAALGPKRRGSSGYGCPAYGDRSVRRRQSSSQNRSLRRSAGSAHLLSLHLLKKLQKTGFRSRGAPTAQEFHAFRHKVQLLQIQKKILEPKGSPLADGNQLSRLVMGIA